MIRALYGRAVRSRLAGTHARAARDAGRRARHAARGLVWSGRPHLSGRQWLSANGGDIHFDTEGLLDDERESSAPARSIIVMLQAPARGGGLRVWDTAYEGEDEVEEPEDIASETIEYAAGDL